MDLLQQHVALHEGSSQLTGADPNAFFRETVQALEPTTCLMINGLTLRRVLEESPETMKQFQETIGERLEVSWPGRENESYSDPRVAS